MKRLFAAVLAIASVFSAVAVALSRRTPEPIQTDYSRTYIFREHDGKVACFEEDESEPFLITDIRVDDLTPTDRVLLAAGVEAHGARAMSRILEDYCS